MRMNKLLFRLCSKYVIWKVRRSKDLWVGFRHALAMALLDNFRQHYPPSVKKTTQLNNWGMK